MKVAEILPRRKRSELLSWRLIMRKKNGANGKNMVESGYTPSMVPHYMYIKLSYTC